MNEIIRRPLAVALALAVALLTGLASSPANARSTDSKAHASQSRTKVTVGAVRVAGSAALALGQQKGFFRKAGLDVTLNFQYPPSQFNAALLSGDLDFGVQSWGGLTAVAANGVPLKAIANIANAHKSGQPDDGQMVVMPKSPIKSAKQLGGKTIAVGTLNGIGEATIRDAAARAGVPQNTLKFVAVNFPDMSTALRAGRIDAAFAQEPFITAMKMQSKVRLLPITQGSFISGLPLNPLITTEKYGKANPRVVAAMRKASNQSVAYARKNPKKIRKLLPKLIGISPAIANRMVLPDYSSTMDLAKVQRLINALYRFDKLRTKISAQSMVLR